MQAILLGAGGMIRARGLAGNSTRMDSRDQGDPGAAGFRVEKYPFFLLNRLVGRYNIVIEGRLRGIGLGIPAWRVLMILGERDGRGVREIADGAIIPLSTMTRIVQRMAAAGLVAASGSRTDARITTVSLLPAGRAKLAEARRVTAPVYRKIIAGFTEQDFVRLLDALGAMQANLDTLHAPRK